VIPWPSVSEIAFDIHRIRVQRLARRAISACAEFLFLTCNTRLSLKRHNDIRECARVIVSQTMRRRLIDVENLQRDVVHKIQH